jgi:hypothetical protein
MTLSVCCITSDPGARVARILNQLRPFADEVLVAVDSRVDPDRLGRYAAVADRLMRFEFVDSVEQAAYCIVSQCSGDWILRIDGDEVVTPALVERLPELTSRTDVFQYWLSCRWLFPDADHYIAQPPWRYSTPRLVRNDPATLWHAGLSHGGPEPLFPSVRLDEGYYHLSVLVNDIAYREAKVAHYLSIRSGHSRRVLEDDITAFYLPEADRRFAVAPVPVPARDRPAIAEVLSAAGAEQPGPPAADIPLWTWPMIQRVWPRRTLADDAYQGRIEAFEGELRLACAQQRAITVRVGNDGDEHWPGMEREPSIKLSHRWRATGADASGEWTDTPLPASLAAGASALVPVAVEAPARAGSHTLELTLVHRDLMSGKLVRRFAGAALPIEVYVSDRSDSLERESAAGATRLRASLARLRGRRATR